MTGNWSEAQKTVALAKRRTQMLADTEDCRRLKVSGKTSPKFTKSELERARNNNNSSKSSSSSRVVKKRVGVDSQSICSNDSPPYSYVLAEESITVQSQREPSKSIAQSNEQLQGNKTDQQPTSKASERAKVSIRLCSA